MSLKPPKKSDQNKRWMKKRLEKGIIRSAFFENAKKWASENPNGYKHVLVIYDIDDFPADHINRTAELCDQNTTFPCGYPSKGVLTKID